MRARYKTVNTAFAATGDDWNADAGEWKLITGYDWSTVKSSLERKWSPMHGVTTFFKVPVVFPGGPKWLSRLRCACRSILYWYKIRMCLLVSNFLEGQNSPCTSCCLSFFFFFFFFLDFCFWEGWEVFFCLGFGISQRSPSVARSIGFAGLRVHSFAMKLHCSWIFFSFGWTSSCPHP